MAATLLEPTARKWTVAELRLLPADQRDAILAQAADQACDDYAHDQDFTDEREQQRS